MLQDLQAMTARAKDFVRHHSQRPHLSLSDDCRPAKPDFVVDPYGPRLEVDLPSPHFEIDLPTLLFAVGPDAPAF